MIYYRFLHGLFSLVACLCSTDPPLLSFLCVEECARIVTHTQLHLKRDIFYAMTARHSTFLYHFLSYSNLLYASLLLFEFPLYLWPHLLLKPIQSCFFGSTSLARLLSLSPSSSRSSPALYSSVNLANRIEQMKE